MAAATPVAATEAATGVSAAAESAAWSGNSASGSSRTRIPTPCRATTAIAAWCSYVWATICATSAVGICAAPAVSIPATSAIGVTAAISIASAIPPAVIPRAGADEEPAVEPFRSVVAVGRAAIGGIGVITPFAHRGTINHGSRNDLGANSNPHPLLGVRSQSEG